MTQRHQHVFGSVVENDRHHTLFTEGSVSGTNGGHTWALGSAARADLYRSREVSRFDYTYVVPAVSIQDDYVVSPRLSLSGSGRVDFHSDYGTFFNPRVSALVRLPREFTVRFSTGTGVFAPTPFTEDTEAVGLSNLQPLRDLEAERAWSASADLGWKSSQLELNGVSSDLSFEIQSHFGLTSAGGLMEIVNAQAPTRTLGSEFLMRVRRGNFGITGTHTFVYSTEVDPNQAGRREVPLTPRHSVGVVGMWEKDGQGRIGIEVFYTGQQRLDDNPYRTESRPYWILECSRSVASVRSVFSSTART